MNDTNIIMDVITWTNHQKQSINFANQYLLQYYHNLRKKNNGLMLT